jgi:hypothetical protein
VTTARSDIIERLAMALIGRDCKPLTAAAIRKRWKLMTHSLQSVYLGAAEEVFADASKSGLRISLAPKVKKRKGK